MLSDNSGYEDHSDAAPVDPVVLHPDPVVLHPDPVVLHPDDNSDTESATETGDEDLEVLSDNSGYEDESHAAPVDLANDSTDQETFKKVAVVLG